VVPRSCFQSLSRSLERKKPRDSCSGGCAGAERRGATDDHIAMSPFAARTDVLTMSPFASRRDVLRGANDDMGLIAVASVPALHGPWVFVSGVARNALIRSVDLF
jgi:hypothetical protein